MRLFILFICVTLSLSAIAQKAKEKKIKYTKTASGLRYSIVYNAGGPVAENDGAVFFKTWIYKVEKGKKDSLIHQSNDGGILISANYKKGGIEEGLRMLSAGDSAIYLINVDSFFTGNMTKPEFLNKAQDLRFVIKATRVATTEEVKTELNARAREALAQKYAQAEAYKQDMLADDAVKLQLQKDEQVLQEYLTNNPGKVSRTQNGVYYQIITQGTGPANVIGDTVKVYYTGKFLDGRVFDSNASGSQPPFSFVLGVMDVIMGWDEAVAVLKKGDKAILYIPSALAYGERGAGSDIPPNTCLIFEVQIVE